MEVKHEGYLQAQIADRDNQRYEPGDGGFLKSASIEKTSLRGPEMQTHDSEIDDSVKITEEIDMLHRNPSYFISRDCYKRFPKPHGVHHGIVSEVVSSDPPIWDIQYNDGDSEHYSVEDMINYCIKMVDGVTIAVNPDDSSQGGEDMIGDHPCHLTKNKILIMSQSNWTTTRTGRLYYEARETLQWVTSTN